MNHGADRPVDPFADDGEQPVRQRSWLARHWIWLVVLGVVLMVLLCGGIIVLVFGMLKSSGAYKQSVQHVQRHPEVQAALGEPIEPAYFVTGSVELHNKDGHAELTYDVAGPKDSGTVHVVADKRAGVWTMKSLVVAVHGTGERIDVLKGSPRANNAARE